MAIVVEGQRPYTGGTGVEIDGNKVISVLLREENNLILVNNDNELYTDLQLADGIEPDDDLPVGVTVGKVLEDDGWEQNGLLLNWKTTSGDYARWIYGADGKIYFDGGTGERSQVYYSSEVDDLFTALRNSLANVAFTGDYNDLINRPTLPVVYDGTLTIQKNGTTVGDFTANQQANETINITVPVNTSDLNNDSGFIDKNVNDLTYYTATADLATVATTGAYSDLSGTPNLATVATTGDYDDLLDKPNLATVATSGDYNDLTNKPTIPAAQVQSNWTESDNTKVDYIKNKPNLATVATSGSYSDLSNTPNLATVATSGSYADLSNKPTIPSVLDSVSSTSTTDALSANQGKNLQDQINDLKSMGKFLSLWNASTGQPISFPHSTPYTYSTGDYYLVETVSTANPPANKRPSGSSYTGAASTTAETDELEVGDLYIYDGSVWLLQINHGKTVSFANLAGQPTDNAALSTALGAKADTSSLATVATTGSYSDLSNKPTIPAAQVQSNWTESDNTKVEYIKNKPTLATVATSGAYSDLSGTPSLATVATTGSYSDLSNKPTIPAAQVNSDWNASSGVAQILNKPTIPTVNNATLTITQNGTSVGTFTANASSNVTIATTDTTYQSKSAASGGTAVSLVTTGEKYTWNNKQDAISNLSTIESGAAAGATAVQPGDLATVATTGSYSDLSNKPTIPSVYDATITFTQGGTSKGDITLNQSSNETIALDAGFTPGGTATTGYVVTKTANGYEWAAPSSGSGDVVGPASSTDGNIATYDGATGKLIKDSGVAVTDLNTKTFYLTGTTGSTNIATAQAAYDWYLAGKNPIIVYGSGVNQITYILAEKNSSSLTFKSHKNTVSDGNSSSSLQVYYLSLTISSDTVTAISTSTTGRSGSFLRTGKNYSTPYTPEYDGSPATKKYVDDRDTYIGSSAPTSNLVEGRLWYDTTNDQLKVYDGTNWNVTGKEYNAGPGIEIGDNYSAMQGPCPIGFHVPSKDEWTAVKTVWTTLGGGGTDGTNFGIALKLPFAGIRNQATSNVSSQGSYGYYWSYKTYNTYAYYLYFYSSEICTNSYANRSNGYSIRGFKNSPVVPDDTWTTLKSGTGSAGIFWSSTLGLISMSGDGTTWITIADKNVGATTVWNSGDTVSEANCGKYFQRGNNYGFDRTGTLTDTSTTQVDASGYGPGNYYSSSTFIKYSGAWDSSDNGNLRGGETGVISNAITNTGVLSVNGETGNVTVTTHTTTTVTLTSAGWSDNEQTVTATGVTASNTVIISPVPSSFSDYTNAGVYAYSQASDLLTFKSSETPSNDISVNVAIFN